MSAADNLEWVPHNFCAASCVKAAVITLLLGILGAILLRKSLLGRQGRDRVDNVSTGMPVLGCASCGIAEANGVKLQKCVSCDLANYCSDACQEDHRLQHEAKCKERAAELRDEILFKQPEGRHLGDCPICFLPHPIDHNKSSFYSCCSVVVCDGCIHADDTRQVKEDKMQVPRCPFCRHPKPTTKDGFMHLLMKRVEANDPSAMSQMGSKYYYKGDYDIALKYWTKAAELGNAFAHNTLSVMYQGKWKGVEKDEEKEMYHLEQAAIRGHPDARFRLGRYDGRKGLIDRAVKHWTIAANLGCDDAIELLKKCYVEKVISKDDFAAALRAHHAAVDATKSPHRKAAEAEI